MRPGDSQSCKLHTPFFPSPLIPLSQTWIGWQDRLMNVNYGFHADCARWASIMWLMSTMSPLQSVTNCSDFLWGSLVEMEMICGNAPVSIVDVIKHWKLQAVAAVLDQFWKISGVNDVFEFLPISALVGGQQVLIYCFYWWNDSIGGFELFDTWVFLSVCQAERCFCCILVKFLLLGLIWLCLAFKNKEKFFASMAASAIPSTP